MPETQKGRVIRCMSSRNQTRPKATCWLGTYHHLQLAIGDV